MTKKVTGWSTTSRHERGYGYEWDKIRLLILERDAGNCQCPECLGGAKRIRKAREVHHIVSKAEAKRRGWTEEQIDAPSNLQAVNVECHKRMTAAEQGRTLKAKVVIGSDGWPHRDAGR